MNINQVAVTLTRRVVFIIHVVDYSVLRGSSPGIKGPRREVRVSRLRICGAVPLLPSVCVYGVTGTTVLARFFSMRRGGGQIRTAKRFYPAGNPSSGHKTG